MGAHDRGLDVHALPRWQPGLRVTVNIGGNPVEVTATRLAVRGYPRGWSYDAALEDGSTIHLWSHDRRRHREPASAKEG